ncbi:MAG: hypothetical protein II819_07460, partial [Fibrobacter sp.]|nr:hypothetical protein [Fibrobacter sp.]
MPENSHINKGNFASRRLVLLQDTALSVAATLLSVLLVRWLSDPIPGFSAILFRWLGASLVLTVAALCLVGSQRLVQRYATVRSSMRLLWAMFIKVVGLALVVVVGWISLPSPVYVVMALLA